MIKKSSTHIEESDELNQKTSLPNLLKQVGHSNKYQLIMLSIFLIQWMISVYVIIGPLYFLGAPTFLCKNGRQCEEKYGCQQGAILYDSKKITMSTEFQMYCEDSIFRSYSSSITFFGSVFGNFIISFLAENQGRRKMTILAWGISTIGIIGTSLSFNKYMILPFNFLMGFGLVPCNSLNLIMLNEQCGNTFRQKATTILLMSWASFEIFLSGSDFLINNWRIIYLYFLAIPSVIVFFLNFYICESPQFLFTKGRDAELFEEFNKIANKNGKPLISQEQLEELLEERNILIQETSSLMSQNDFDQDNLELQLRKKSSSKKSILRQKQQYHFLDLFSIKSLRYISIASCITMFAMQFIYYTTQLSLNNVGNNLYVNAVLVACGETISFFICNRIIEKLPRKMGTIFFMGLCNLLCLLEFLIGNFKLLQTVNAAFIRIANCMTQGILAVFVQELYPTPTRSLGVGLQMGIGLLGSTLAPFAVDLFEKYNISEMGGVGIIILPLNLINVLFIETKGQELQDIVQEENSKNNKLQSKQK